MLSRAPLFTNKKGFTLIELMVGMVVAVMVMGMTYAIFTSQLKLTKTEMSINDLQLNTQTALRYLSKKMRNLGYGVTTKIPVPSIMWYDGDEGTSAGGGNGQGGGNSPSSSSVNFWPDDNLPYSDVLAFYSTNLPTSMTVIDYNANSQELKLKKPTVFDGTTGSANGQANNPYVGGLLLVYDDANETYTVVQITAIADNMPGFTNIVFNPGWGDNLNTGLPFIPSNALYLGDFNLIYVDNNNVLRIKKSNGENIPLMNNVLSLQVEAGMDTDGDNVVDSWTYNESDLPSLYDVKALKMFVFTATTSEQQGVSMGVMDRINQLDQNANGLWSQEVNWSAVLNAFAETHGTTPGVPRVYSFACELRNVFTCN